MAAKKRRSRLDEFHEAFLDKERTIRDTMRAAKGLSAEKADDWRSHYAHPELMEEAELRAEQVSEERNQNSPEEDN